jgi:hypothetical protein
MVGVDVFVGVMVRVRVLKGVQVGVGVKVPGVVVGEDGMTLEVKVGVLVKGGARGAMASLWVQAVKAKRVVISRKNEFLEPTSSSLKKTAI